MKNDFYKCTCGKYLNRRRPTQEKEHKAHCLIGIEHKVIMKTQEECSKDVVANR